MRTLDRASHLLLVGIIMGISGGSIAQDPPSGGEFTMRRSTIDSGGGQSLGGAFSVQGTIGQADTATMTGGAFVLRSGFWTTQGAVTDLIFANGFEGDP